MLHFFKVKNAVIILASLFVLLAAAPSQAGSEAKLTVLSVDAAESIKKCRAASWFRINGVGVSSTDEIQVAQALKLCQKAEKLAPNNAKVWAYLARVYIKINRFKKAFFYLKKTMKKGNKEGVGLFGYVMQQSGSFKQASEALLMSANLGSPFAQFHLSELYMFGQGVEKNHKLAKILLLDAAKGGFDEAQYKLGMAYKIGYFSQIGKKVSLNDKEAFIWFEKATLQGHQEATIELGKLYISKPNLEKAILIFSDLYNKGVDESALLYGIALQKRGRKSDMKKAYQVCDKALKTRRKKYKSDHDDIADALRCLGEITYSLAKYDEAIQHFVESQKIYEKTHGKNSLLVARNFTSLGVIYRDMSRYNDAVHAHSKALRILESLTGDYDEDIADVLNNLAVVLSDLGQVEKSFAYYKKSLNFMRKKHGNVSKKTAIVLGNIANVYLERGKPKEALKFYKVVLNILLKEAKKDESVRYSIAMTLWNTGVCYKDLEKHSESLQYYEKALALYRVLYGDIRPENARILSNIAQVHTERHSYKKAYKFSTLSMVINTALDDLDGLKYSYSAIAETFVANDKFISAILYAKLAVNTQQKIRAQNKGLKKELATSLAESKRSTYQFLYDLLVNENRHAEAEQVMAMLKQREFFTFMKRGQADERAGQIAFTALEQVAVNQFNEALQVPVSIGRELQKLEDKKRKGQKLDAAQLARLKTLTTQQDKALKALQQKMQVIMENLLKNPDNLQNAVVQETALMGKLKKLGKNVALYQSVVMKDKVHLLVFTGSGAVARKTVIDKAVLSKKIAEFRAAISSQGAVKQKAKALYDLLIKPVEADLKASGAKTVLLSLDGVLRYLPYAALYDGKHYLIEKFSLVLDTPMARPFWQDKAADWTLADGFGMSKGAENFSALPNVENELAGIVVGADGKGILPGKAYLNEAFTQDSLKNGLRSSAPVLHIATHFQFKAGYPAGSHLLLGDGSHLNLATMARQPAAYDFSGKDLVALSACQTALGSSRGAMGAEIDGLGALIVSQGGKSVLATLWSVADKSTSLLMQRFYELRAKDKMGKGQALATAQREFLKNAFGTLGKGKSIVLALARGGQKLGQPVKIKTGTQLAKDYPGFSHPYYWAPFVLMGNWK